MATESLIVIRDVSWASHEPELRLVRTEVFLREQRIDESDEWEAEVDPTSAHVLAYVRDGDALQLAGCARIDALPNKPAEWRKVSRVAVLKPFRKLGVASTIMRHIVGSFAPAAGVRHLKLHAQTYAMGLYAKTGFATVGDEFDECGIPHVEMELHL